MGVIRSTEGLPLENVDEIGNYQKFPFNLKNIYFLCLQWGMLKNLMEDVIITITDLV
jgi:hypothetical protein